MSEVVDFFPGSFDSSLCFIHPGISHDALCKQGDDIQLYCTPFSVWGQAVAPRLYSMKRQKDLTLKERLPRSVGA